MAGQLQSGVGDRYRLIEHRLIEHRRIESVGFDFRRAMWQGRRPVDPRRRPPGPYRPG